MQFVMGVPKVPARSVQSGLPNPYGVGASAFEPQTEVYSPGSDPLMRGSSMQLSGYDAVDKKKADDEAAAQLAKQQADAQAAGVSVSGSLTGASPSGPTINANGAVLSFVNAAKTLLGKPYVWGGTTASGVDCSGLLYYAFNAAGIKMPRYRASDYGKMGQAVSGQDARAGDIVFWNEPGDTDHVGIYLGNGYVLNSPHSGTVVQVDRVWGNPTYRRIIQDNNWGEMTTSSGGSVPSYAGAYAYSVFAPTATTPGVTAGASVQMNQRADIGNRVNAI